MSIPKAFSCILGCVRDLAFTPIAISISPSYRSRSQHRAARSRLRLHRAISPLVEPSRLSLFLLLSIWLDLMIFFFLGFVCVSVLRNEWYYIFVWQPRKCEKMWATSRKCVFYGIFKNTTKHQKIFFETFFEMQSNTWKHFPFRKIAFSGNAFTQTKRSLNSSLRLSWNVMKRYTH